MNTKIFINEAGTDYNARPHDYSEKSLIDQMLTNKISKGVKAIPSGSQHSDHRLTQPEVRAKVPKIKNKKKSKRFMLKTLKTKNVLKNKQARKQ